MVEMNTCRSCEGCEGIRLSARLRLLASSVNLEILLKDRETKLTRCLAAYGDAAALCLKHYHVLDNNPDFKLRLLIAYYPTEIPDPEGRFPNNISALVHFIAGEDVGVTKQTQLVGIQGKKRTSRRTIHPGMGTGGLLQFAFPSYTYQAQAGFAEHDLDEYNMICAGLAWSRSLATARKAFAQTVDLEHVWEENVQGKKQIALFSMALRLNQHDVLNDLPCTIAILTCYLGKFFTHNLGPTMSTYTTHKSPHVTYMPTLTGGIGTEELQEFYSEYFGNPKSLKLTLISRTIGADRIVDEIHVRFKHTQEMPWILPGVPPTQKAVRILVVSIVTLRGGKLFHEHVYWDQASVLVQIGALDPNVVPETARKIGIKKLPIVDGAAASRVLKGWDPETEGEADNELIPGWHDDEEDEDEGEDEAGDKSAGKKPAGNDNAGGEIGKGKSAK